MTESSPAAALPETRFSRERLRTNRNWLGFLFMIPAAGFLIVFLAYPLGLGVWLSFTDTRIGRAGQWIGLENYIWLWDDGVFWLSVFNTLLYTIVASTIKFAIGYVDIDPVEHLHSPEGLPHAVDRH